MKKFLVLSLACLFLLTGCQAAADYRIKRQLDLGDQYLVELEYEKAMLAYGKALQIEPKTVGAYKGLSDVFTAQNEIGSSVKALKKGLACADDMPSAEKDAQINAQIKAMSRQIVTQLTDLGDQAFADARYEKAARYYQDLIVYDQEEADPYLKLSQTYEAMGDLERALEVLTEADVTDRQLEEERDRVAVRYEIKKEYEELLGRLAGLIQANDGQLAKEVLLTEDFLELVSRLTEPLIFPQDGDKSIVVYPDGYVYIGQTDGLNRQGYGDYYTNNRERYVVYSGEWADDKPNGSGRIDVVVYTSQTTLSPNYYGEGTFLEGVSEGAFEFSVFYQNGNRYDYVLTNTGGIPPCLERRQGKNLIGYSVSDPNYYFLMADNSIFAVPNFEPDGYSSIFTESITTH